MEDHDALILLGGQITNLTSQVAANANQSAERDARAETKIDRIDGAVDAQAVWQIRHTDVPHPSITAERAAQIDQEHTEMWTVYRVMRWIFVLFTGALVVQAVAIVGYVITHWS